MVWSLLFPAALSAPRPAGPIPHIPKRGDGAMASLLQEELWGTGAEGSGKERSEHHQELHEAAKVSVRLLVSSLAP